MSSFDDDSGEENLEIEDDVAGLELTENNNKNKVDKQSENMKNNLKKSLIVKKDSKKFNQSINYLQQDMHNQIAKNLNVNEEINENNDADPEELIQRSPEEMNKTVDDIFTVQMFGVKEPNEKIVPFDSREATLFERMLHPMQYGSLRGSIFALSSMCLDSGALVLANRCQQFGMINFVVFLVLGGVMAYWSLVMMIRAARNMNERDYSKVVKAILGKKIGIFLDINICLYLFGALISFQVIIFSLIGSVVYDLSLIFGDSSSKNFNDFTENTWKNNYIKFPVMFGVVTLVLPLCLLKDVSKMRFASLFGVLALVYSILVIVFESPFFFINTGNYKRFKKINWFDMRRAFTKETNFAFFGGIATVFYVYSCHAGAFPVYKTLRNNTTRRIKKVFRRSIILDIIIYVCVSIGSFLTTPFKPDDLIVYRKSLNSFPNDYFMIAAKIGIIFDLFFSTPANYAAFRISVFELIWGNTNITNFRNIVVTVFSLGIIALIGAVYSDILSYISLLGGFCSTIYCFLIPGWIYTKNNRYTRFSLENIFTMTIVITLTIIGYVSGIFTILFDIVKVGKKSSN